MASPATIAKRDAWKILRDNGFTVDDTKIILSAARKNGRDPVMFARRAIRLREHVQAGARL